MALLRLGSIATAILALATVASAATDLVVTAPAAWHLDREKSATMNLTSQDAHHFGRAPSIDVTEAYFPAEPGVALIVTRSTTTALPEGRDAAIAAAIGDLEGWVTRNAPIANHTGGRSVVDDGKVLEVTTGGRDVAAGTSQMSRMIVVADATKVVTVTGSCLGADTTAPAAIAACVAALATLETGVPAADRATLAFAPAAPVAAVTPEATPTQLPSMSDGTKYKMAPIAIPQDDSSDHRIVYFGIGLVVFAIIFYWNRKHRERFDADKGGDPKAPRKTRARERDGDADALHAAADATDDPESNHHD